MTPKQFQRYLDRDGGCLHCGLNDETLVPQHRKGKGLGGSKLLDNSSNIIVFCSYYNGLIESNAIEAEKAIYYGWKVSRWQSPEEIPVFSVISGKWWILTNDYKRIKYK